MKNICLLIIVIVLVGCSHSQDSKPSIDTSESIEPIQQLVFKASYFDYGVSGFIDRNIESGAKFHFPLISGHIFGAYVSEDPLFTIEYIDGGTFTLALSDDLFTGDILPSMLVPSGIGNNFYINPSDALLGRLGTFAKTEDNVGISSAIGYGFYDQGNQTAFFIVYFDQAATLTGRDDSNGYDVTIDISAPESGFYAVTASKAGNVNSKDFSVRAFNPSNDLYFVIYVDTNKESSKVRSVKRKYSPLTSVCKLDECSFESLAEQYSPN